MRKFIKTVTITGADDSVTPQQLYTLSQKYPFVEWGILLSQSQIGGHRFPSLKWMKELWSTCPKSVNLSGHICGKWVREIGLGNGQDFQTALPFATQLFGRFQLNFHGYHHKIQEVALTEYIRGLKQQIILQLDGVNDPLLTFCESQNLNVVGLFDLSGGIGQLPEKWERSNKFIGYAGGLSPENVVENIETISGLASTEIWIDVETNIRSNIDQQFDLGLVEEFLHRSAPYVV